MTKAEAEPMVSTSTNAATKTELIINKEKEQHTMKSKITRYIPIILIIALVLVVWFLANSIKIVKQQYNEREYNLATYNQANYNITGELYAVKPDGTEVVVDAAGKLWEIPDLKITRHDKLLLEVKDNIVINVWVLSYTRPTN